MTSDHLTPEQRAGSDVFSGMKSCWCLGVAVDIPRTKVFHTSGRFSWTGDFDTTAYTDPAEGMIGTPFTQPVMNSPERPEVFTDFWTPASLHRRVKMR